jgi:cellulose synthase/poly-beta-1,6-N-acetylglucosamine synthase-like glycosyltransferase
MTDSSPTVSIVVPTIGRPCLADLVSELVRQVDTWDRVELLVVDDRRHPHPKLQIGPTVTVLQSEGAGPAAARNVGWRAARHDWIVFLDDDVTPGPGWWPALRADLDGAAPEVGGVQARIDVPAPDGPLDDWQRETVGLTDGEWITADIAYRAAALRTVGGFDERFPRAYREDAELAHRVRTSGWALHRGVRRCIHPVRPESPWASMSRQRGNADDALLRRLYGSGWRRELGIPRGRRSRHAAVAASAAVAAISAVWWLAAGRRGPAGWAAAACAGAWFTGTAEFAVHRARRAPGSLGSPGPLIVTSAAIPPLAVMHWLAGWYRHRDSTAIPVSPRSAAPTHTTVAS